MSGFEDTTYCLRQAVRVRELSDRVQLLLTNPDKWRFRTLLRKLCRGGGI
jgi:hypothetical protein